MKLGIFLLVILAEVAISLKLFLPLCDASCQALQHFVVAEELFADGRLEEAVDEYGQVIGLEPDNAAAYRVRGFAYYRSGRFGPAIEDYTEATRLEPDDFKAYWGRSLAHHSLGRPLLAEADYDRADTLRGWLGNRGGVPLKHEINPWLLRPKKSPLITTPVAPAYPQVIVTLESAL